MGDLESLPIDVLWKNFFSKLPLETIDILCQTSSQFSVICKDELLWQIKTQNDYPELADKKLPTSSWNQYYHFLNYGKQIPVYYNGDRIGYIPFSQSNLNTIPNLLLDNFSEFHLSEIVNIVCLKRI